MATIRKMGERWRVQIRLKGFKQVARTFDKRAQAVAWASKTTEEIKSGGYSDPRVLGDFTIAGLVSRYINEIGAHKPFGRSKLGSLGMLKRHMGRVTLAALNDDALIAYAKKRGDMGAGGVTIGLEFCYLGNILKIVRGIWKIPYRGTPIEDARPALKMMGLLNKSRERDRRPTQIELDTLCAHFNGKMHQKVPMSDIIKFAVASAMRASEIMSIRWDDIDHADRTVIIRNRKHPTEKFGNNQTVPLLGDAYAIVMRQPRKSEFIFPYNVHTISSIFPRACHENNIVDLRFHDLRHEGVSRLFEQRYQIEEVALVSGHRDWKQLRRYTQVRAKNLHRHPLHDEGSVPHDG